MTAWHSHYLPSADRPAVVAALHETLTRSGYTLFNPFGALPGRTYPHAVRLFVAPARDGWTRVIGEAPVAVVSALSRFAPVLSLALDADRAASAVYVDDAPAALDALSAYRRAAHTATPAHTAADTTTPPASDMPFVVLPVDVQALADSVDPQQAEALFARLTGSLTRRAGHGEAAAGAARQLINASHPPQWDSAAGRQLRTLVDSLTMPSGWREPDFVTLRDAYQLYERRQRRPNADLYPGDAEAMARVPDALDYTPVYAGKDTE